MAFRGVEGRQRAGGGGAGAETRHGWPGKGPLSRWIPCRPPFLGSQAHRNHDVQLEHRLKSGRQGTGEGPPPWARAVSSRAMAQSVLEAFRRFDRDGSGGISREELAEVLGALGPEWDDAAVDELLSAADGSGDGELQVEERAIFEVFRHEFPKIFEVFASIFLVFSWFFPRFSHVFPNRLPFFSARPPGVRAVGLRGGPAALAGRAGHAGGLRLLAAGAQRPLRRAAQGLRPAAHLPLRRERPGALLRREEAPEFLGRRVKTDGRI